MVSLVRPFFSLYPVFNEVDGMYLWSSQIQTNQNSSFHQKKININFRMLEDRILVVDYPNRNFTPKKIENSENI